MSGPMGSADKKLQVLQSGGSNDTAWTLNAYSEDGGKFEEIPWPSGSGVVTECGASEFAL